MYRRYSCLKNYIINDTILQKILRAYSFRKKHAEDPENYADTLTHIDIFIHAGRHIYLQVEYIYIYIYIYIYTWSSMWWRVIFKDETIA